MALRTLIASEDCIQEYERAAREHQESGLILLAGGYAQGVALMALSVEMVLKAAYFRFVGYAPDQPISRADLRDVEADIRTLGVTQNPEGFHNLLFWAEALAAVRRQGLPARTHGGARAASAVAAVPMSLGDEAALLGGAARLRTNWSIGDRYKAIQPHADKQDLEDVFDDAVTIVGLYDAGRM